MSASQADQEFQQLRHQYIQGLPRRLEQIQAAWNRLQHISWDPKILAALTGAVHKLNASGSTFGLPHVTRDAEQLEQLLRQLQTPETSGAVDRRDISRVLGRLSHTASQARNETTAGYVPAPPNPAAEAPFHIAVIEDDPGHARHIQTVLEKLGYDAHLFASPDAWSRDTRDYGYQLLLLGVSSPQARLEGLAWLERLRETEATLPIALLTERTDMVARMRALQAGADLYLTKPLDVTVLSRHIQRLQHPSENTGPRVLWADDDTDLLAHYQALLTERGYQFDALPQAVRLLERVEAFQPDVIVLDYEMSGCTGLKLAQMLRQDPRYMNIPILFVSASAGGRPSSDQDISNQVGNAFFQKPLNDNRFLRCLQSHIAQTRLFASPPEMSRYDAAQLQKPHEFLASLEVQLAASEPESVSARHYLICISIDNEPYLKARYGMHAMVRLGAQLEKHLARQPAVNSAGCAMGSGRFLLLLEAPASIDGAPFVEAFHQSLNGRDWVPVPFNRAIGLSMGAVHLDPALDVDRALSQAEAACTRAAKAGGGQWTWYATDARTGLTNHLRELLRARAFTLHYQPVMNMDNDDTLFEALVRLVDDDQAVYMPSQFLPWLPSGSRSNFDDLDRWVIEHAVDNLVKLEARTSVAHSVIVKLSSPLADVELMQPFVAHVIRKSGLKHIRQIYLAFSNPTVLKDIPRARRVFEHMRKLGCGIIVEHVEPGSSIVQLLQDVGSVDFVKLNPEYGAMETHTPELELLLDQLTAFFGSSQPIIVTGVEDARVLTKFWERGIRYFQGYFIQKPGLMMNHTAAHDS
ncbi:EAL domain-containing response regulator [Marinobacter fonticola]|uniref:EAL domain-containing response regulator n=1 Tax=Marinobacter fonticola TaxID=2603215 RepID=UPI00143CDB7C|nr:response regulator [Marinobacter fonticola]